MTPLLEIKNLTSQITREGRPLLNAVSFSLNKSDRLVLKGASGSGKSLLLRSLIFLDPLSSGEVFLNGKLIAPKEVPHYRSQVIYHGQKPSLLEGTVQENLEGPFSFQIHQNKKYDRQIISHYLSIFNLQDSFLNQSAKLLSGGEAQIVALLRALILQPQILLLDEPTASLDKARGDIFEREIIRWVEDSPAEEQNRSFIWVTHQKEQALKMGTSFLSL